MDSSILIITLIIQIIAIAMVIYTFQKISAKKMPEIDVLEKYHIMRQRFEHLRWSLLFVGAMIAVQVVGVFYYFRNGSIPVLGLVISNVIIMALTVFLSQIYKKRSHLEDLEFKK